MARQTRPRFKRLPRRQPPSVRFAALLENAQRHNDSWSNPEVRVKKDDPLFATLGLAQPKPVIRLGGIVHKTNTFNPKKTTLADFATGIGGADGTLRGQDLITNSIKANNTTAGFIHGAAQYGLTLYPTLVADPQTLGTVFDSAFETLTRELIDRLRQAPKLDGILLFHP